MARMAVAEGMTTVVCTPHQAGAFSDNRGSAIRSAVDALRNELAREGIPLEILPGGDVRIESELVKDLISGEILSLGDHRRHVLLELPHELYFPLEGLHAELMAEGITGILSHPERNRGIIKNPDVMWDVIEAGGLLQITAASLTGSFGLSCQEIAELAVDEGLIHFIASDAHDTEHRPFGMREAYDTICDMGGEKLADLVCCENPSRVFEGDDVKGGIVGKTARRSTQKRVKKQKKGFGFGWFDH